MKEIIEIAKKSIPSLGAILKKALQDLDLDELSNDFGRVLLRMDERATSIFKQCERESIIRLAKEMGASSGEGFGEYAKSKGWADI